MNGDFTVFTRGKGTATTAVHRIWPLSTLTLFWPGPRRVQADDAVHVLQPFAIDTGRPRLRPSRRRHSARTEARPPGMSQRCPRDV
jgi:hypothetical protein